MSTSRRARRWLVALGLGASVALVAAIAPAAVAERPTHAGSGYLALGDSVAFGYRPPEVTAPTAYLNANNFGGYAEDLAGFDSLTLANASCPGETSGSLITSGAQSNGCENSLGSPAGYRTRFPLHVDYSGTQLAYAVGYLRAHPRTQLVTVSIGANDLFVCQQTTADHCTGADFAAALARISANVTTLFSALRHQAHYHHTLILVAYYALSYSDPVQVAGTQALNNALAGATRQFGGVVADGFTAFQRVAAGTGGDPCAAGLLVPLPGGTCNIHPSAYGHAVLAGAIQKVIDRHDN
ncbi:MAG: SGNH/GDSL hydrolase family protein [Pseudonocardiales bacterium]|nr:MAG: SGNH/GDSL hydrolase family protein [Pseudonocardiales bacterium]